MIKHEIQVSYNNQLELMLPRFYLDGKTIKLIELFGGIGSQAKALEILSKYCKEVIFEHHKLIEFDRYCIISYNAIHGTNHKTKDITRISYSDLEIRKDENIYLLTYSFPCQDLSIAGNKQGMDKGSGTRSSLLWEVERILKEGQSEQLPHILLMENVPQIQGVGNRYNFYLWKRTLEDLGYTNFVKQLNSKDFGIPQSRNRCFMISILFDNLYYYFPDKIELNYKLNTFLEQANEIDKNNFLSDRLILHLLKENKFDRKGRFLGHISKLNKPFAFTIKTNDGKTAIDNFILEDSNINVNSLFEKSNEEIKNILKNKIRRLTAKEYWKLMGFADEDFKKVYNLISNTQLYKQAGNSIVVPTLIAIFSKLYENIDYEKIINLYVKDEILGGLNEKKE